MRLVGDRKEPQTLRRMFESFDLQDPSQLTVRLGINPAVRSVPLDSATDPEFNRAGKSCGDSRLFLTRDTLQGGRYFGGGTPVAR